VRRCFQRCPSTTNNMKRILTLLALLTFVTVTTQAASWRVKAERSFYTAPNGEVVTNAVAVTWLLQPETPQAYEIQRKLFPWGWRKLAVVNSNTMLWIDKKSAKRGSWYRVRAIYEDHKSPWSGKAYTN
jgi:hypothetical protein